MQSEDQRTLFNFGFVGSIIHAILFFIAPYGPLLIYGNSLVPSTTVTGTIWQATIVISSLMALVFVGSCLIWLVWVWWKVMFCGQSCPYYKTVFGTMAILLCNSVLLRISAWMHDTTPVMPHVDSVAAAVFVMLAMYATWAAVMMPHYLGHRTQTAS